MLNLQPISRVEWLEPELLTANDYNPNHVFGAEFRLLEFSIVKTGWIQPILTDQNLVIIDGFHRHLLGLNSMNVRRLTDGLVPIVRMDLSDSERKMLTVRINRAKGAHIAVKMSDLVKSLIDEHGLSVQDVCEGIGATKDEVDLLMMDSVFKAKKIDEHKYSKAWIPK